MANAATSDLRRWEVSSRLIWWPQIFFIAFIITLAILDAIWLQISGVGFVFGGVVGTIPLGLFFAAIGLVYAVFRPAPRLSLAALSLAEIILFTIPGCIFSYAVMRMGRPLVDPMLVAWDAKLGFDWVSYVAFIHRYAWVRVALHWAYMSFFYQLITLNFILCLCGRYALVNRLLANFMIGGIITTMLGALYPALGGYYYFHIPDHGISSFSPAIEASRTRILQVIDMDHVEGLVQFPSFHAQVSIALILTAWPIPLLRYPILILNLVVLVSTPVYGAHYLVDILAGTALVIVFNLCWQKFERWMGGKTEQKEIQTVPVTKVA